MIDYVRKILTGQFGASLCMLNACIQKCPATHWDGRIAKFTFWTVAYHTLCFVDLYLSPNEESFQPRDGLHPRGWDEFHAEIPSRRFDKSELSAYVAICRQKAVATLAAETRESLERNSGFAWLPFSRGELHVYNIRHVQHHAGQLSAYLRRIDETLQNRTALKWIRTGWE
ncbi:MAG TPA: DinB family protein [bacterium]|nr:DinB family protein [bacterium]